ncbi:MAG: fumarylacetoacetate hydrolase family protein [Micromonosporaceae bacterium]
MRLASYRSEGRARVGVVHADGSISAVGDLNGAPAGMIDVIESWDELRPALAGAGSAAPAGSAAVDHVAALDAENRWLPPVPRPSKMLGVALNNKALAALTLEASPHPALFSYPPSALTGHHQPIELRADYGLTHPEPELGVVIGKRCKHVSVENALHMVFGYTIVDDITSPTLKSGDTVVIPRSRAEGIGAAQPEDGSPPPGFEHGDLQLTYHARSKGSDTFAPCGPWIVTADEIPAPNSLAVSLSIGDELCTEDNTGHLMFSVPEVIAHASSYFTLEPGDIIHVGSAARGKYRLRDIDYQERLDAVRTIEIEGIGALVNQIRRTA